jgi:hypothetical protein
MILQIEYVLEAPLVRLGGVTDTHIISAVIELYHVDSLIKHSLLPILRIVRVKLSMSPLVQKGC